MIAVDMARDVPWAAAHRNHHHFLLLLLLFLSPISFWFHNNNNNRERKKTKIRIFLFFFFSKFPPLVASFTTVAVSRLSSPFIFTSIYFIFFTFNSRNGMPIKVTNPQKAAAAYVGQTSSGPCTNFFDEVLISSWSTCASDRRVDARGLQQQRTGRDDFLSPAPFFFPTKWSSKSVLAGK